LSNDVEHEYFEHRHCQYQKFIFFGFLVLKKEFQDSWWHWLFQWLVCSKGGLNWLLENNICIVVNVVLNIVLLGYNIMKYFKVYREVCKFKQRCKSVERNEKMFKKRCEHKERHANKKSNIVQPWKHWKPKNCKALHDPLHIKNHY